MIPMPVPITDPAEDGLDPSMFDEAFLAAEAELAEGALLDEPGVRWLTPDDLRERANRLRPASEEGDDLEPPDGYLGPVFNKWAKLLV